LSGFKLCVAGPAFGLSGVLPAGEGRAALCLAACLDVKPLMGHYKKTVEITIEDGINSGKYNKFNN